MKRKRTGRGILDNTHRLRRIDKNELNVDWDEWDEFAKRKNRSDLLSLNLKNNNYLMSIFDSDMNPYFDLAEARTKNDERFNKLKDILNENWDGKME